MGDWSLTSFFCVGGALLVIYYWRNSERAVTRDVALAPILDAWDNQIKRCKGEMPAYFDEANLPHLDSKILEAIENAIDKAHSYDRIEYLKDSAQFLIFFHSDLGQNTLSLRNFSAEEFPQHWSLRQVIDSTNTCAEDCPSPLIQELYMDSRLRSLSISTRMQNAAAKRSVTLSLSSI